MTPTKSLSPTPLTAALLLWYGENGRDLPWRDIKDPYRIWVSEIILQQTRVDQGRDYYHRFIKTFPKVEDLARAKEDEVLRLWQGLGYYSRARNLHRAARMIVEERRGAFPNTYNDLLRLPGVGTYSAAAIGSFAFGLPLAVVDGNVYRVLSRYFGIDLPIDTTEGKKYYAHLADNLLPKDRAADFNQAIMDFGALQCTPSSPDCSQCPLFDTCTARAENTVSSLPRKERRVRPVHRYFTYYIFHTPEGYIIRRRPKGDIWTGLYEFQLIETDRPMTETEALNSPLVKPFTSHIQVKRLDKPIKHVLTHRIIHAEAYLLTTERPLPIPEGYEIVTRDELYHRAMPKLLIEIIKRMEI